MTLADLEMVQVTDALPITSFDCGDYEINDFLHRKSLPFRQELMAVSYAFVDSDKKIIAFFCVSNDTLRDKGYEKWNRLSRKIKNEKRSKNYPAVLIGRLGVRKDTTSKGLGSEILTFIKGWFIFNNKTGCRFIIVDAYNKDKVLKFYERNGFIHLTETDKNNETRAMYFDLMTIQPT